MATEDFELLQAYARDRSQDAFARLVAKYSDMVFATSLRRTRRRDLAEDVTQAVFIVLGRSAEKLHKNGSLAGWLHKTAIYASANALRAERRRSRRERAGAHHEAVEDRIEEESETFAAIEEAMQQLRAGDRDVLALHYLEGLSIEQTAQSLEISIDAARKRLSRALERLRDKLASHGTLLSIGALSSQVGGLATSNGHFPMSYALVAGGKAGRAFELASQVIRAMRMTLLKQAAAAVVTIVAIAGVGKVVFSANAPPRTRLAITDDQPVFARIVPATQPAIATTSPSLALPKVIEDALLANARELSTITVEFHEQTTSNVGNAQQLSALLKIRIEAIEHMLEPRDYRISWQDGKYLSIAQVPDEIVSAFDGSKMYMRSSGVHSTTPLDRERKNAEAQYANGIQYFERAGFSPPSRVIDMSEHRPMRSQILWLLDQSDARVIGIDEQKIDERLLTCIRILMPEPRLELAKKGQIAHLEEQVKLYANNPEAHKNARDFLKVVTDKPTPLRVFAFYLDPKLRYAVRRMQEHSPDCTLLSLTQNGDFEQLEGKSVSLPRSVRIDHYSSGDTRPTIFDKPFTTTMMEAGGFSTKPLEESAFVPQPLPGMRVVDRSGAKEISYRLPGAGTDAKPIAAEVVAAPPSASNSRSPLIIALVVAIVLVWLMLKSKLKPMH